MNLDAYAMKVYSQFEDDGVLLELVRRLNPVPFFVEIGAGHNGENCTHVLLEHGWNGIWVDVHAAMLREAVPNDDRVTIVEAFVTLERLRWYVRDAPKDLGVLSIDVDGNDYWFWQELCRGQGALRPSIVVVEAQIQKPFHEPYVMPYDPDYRWDHKSHDCGASVFSMIELGKELGYTYVGKLSEKHDPNLWFVRNEFAGLLNE